MDSLSQNQILCDDSNTLFDMCTWCFQPKPFDMDSKGKTQKWLHLLLFLAQETLKPYKKPPDIIYSTKYFKKIRICKERASNHRLYCLGIKDTVHFIFLQVRCMPPFTTQHIHTISRFD